MCLVYGTADARAALQRVVKPCIVCDSSLVAKFTFINMCNFSLCELMGMILVVYSQITNYKYTHLCIIY